MAFYTCASCRFSFERRGFVSECPGCGRYNIREATSEEIAELLRNREKTDKKTPNGGNH